MPNRINHFRGNLQQLVRKTYQVIFALSINLGMTTEFRKAGPATVHIANPAAFIAQKLLISARRPAGDRAKDILYIHTPLRRSAAHWTRSELNGTTISGSNCTAMQFAQSIKRSDQCSARVNDLVREAAIMAIGRRLVPRQMANVCEAGLTRIFS